MSVNHSATLSPRQKHHSELAHKLVAAVGGLDDAVEYCRPAKSQLSDYGNPNVLSFIPLDVIEDLEAKAPDPIITRTLARRAGYLLVKMPLVDGGAWGRSLRDLGKEFGDVAGKVSECLGDPDTPGAVTKAEIEKCNLISELDELAEIVAHMRARAVAEVGA